MHEDWELTTLGSVAVNVRTMRAARDESDLPYVALEHVTPGVPFIREFGRSAETVSVTTTFAAGDVLFGKLRPYLNKVAVADRNGCCTGEILVWRTADSARLLPEFLALVLRDRRAIDYAVKLSAGTRMPRTSASQMNRYDVAVPPLYEQKRIVDLIAAIDEAIEASRHCTEQLDLSRIAVLSDMYANLGNHKTAIPEVLEHMMGGAWGDAPGVSECAVSALGPKSFAGDPVVLDPALGTPRSLAAKRLESRGIRENDIILERSGGSENQPVGRVIRAAEDHLQTVPSDFMRLLRVDPSLADPSYVYWVLWLKYRMGATMPFEKRTTSIRNLNIPAYLSVPIALPADRARQSEFVGVAEAFLSEKEALSSKLESLRTLRSQMISSLLSGNHRIPESYDGLLNAQPELISA